MIDCKTSKDHIVWVEKVCCSEIEWFYAKIENSECEQKAQKEKSQKKADYCKADGSTWTLIFFFVYPISLDKY